MMDATVNPAAIATSISIGTSLLVAFFSVWVAMRSARGAAVNRDTTVSILSGIALLLIVLNGLAAALIAVWGMAYFGPVEAVLLLTAAFALVGAVFGLVRGLRRGKRIGIRVEIIPDRSRKV